MSALERLLYAPAGPRGVVATRVVIALHASWIMMSRPCLADLFSWPREFWSGVPHGTLMRYGWLPGIPEKTLFILLLISLPAAMFSRGASLLAAIFLYHFAPLEDAMIGWPGPYLRGLTVDVLALAILACTPPIRSVPSGNFRWPVVLIRFAVAAQYTWGTVAKLRATGLEWFSADNIRNLARTAQVVGFASHAEVVLRHPSLASLIGTGWFVVSILMMVAVVSRPVAWVAVPLTALAHFAAGILFGIVWLPAPLLLVFVNFDQSATANSSAQRASA